MCFGLHAHRRYGSFAVKITCEVSFFVAHSGVSSCSANTRKMVISVCNLPNGRERADATGVLPQLTVCQSHSHCLRHHRSGDLLGARTVTEREYHYALCGSQRNRELPGILSRWISLAEKQVMAHRFVRSPQRERIWQVDIQFSRFKRETVQPFRGMQNQNAPHRGKNTLHYTRHFSAIYKRGKVVCL